MPAPAKPILMILLCLAASPSLAAEPVLLRYKFAIGDQLVYRNTHEEKQNQTILDMKLDSTTKQEVVTSQVVDEIDGDGNALLNTKDVRRKKSMDGQQGKFAFDSQSTDRDTASEIGAAITPYLERLTGSEYLVKVTPRGTVVEVKGFAELIADLVKDNAYGALLAGVTVDNDGAKHTAQEQLVTFSEKPVAPGDTWEDSTEAELKNIGKLKATATYTYEGDDKVGSRKTVRIGVKTDITIDLDLEVPGAKITGPMSTTSSEGTVQFDPAAGRIVSAKYKTSMSGRLNVNAGGMMIPVDNSEEHLNTSELLEKLPE
jgi:hypothetical protein